MIPQSFLSELRLPKILVFKILDVKTFFFKFFSRCFGNLPIVFSPKLKIGFAISILLIFMSSVIRGYSTTVNVGILKQVSTGLYPSNEQWFMWFLLQMFGIYNFVPKMINYFTAKEVSKLSIARFSSDLLKCSATELFSTYDLQNNYAKLSQLEYIPYKFGWCFDSVTGIITAAVIIWETNGYWIFIVLGVTIISVIFNEYLASRDTRKALRKEQTTNYTTLRRVFSYIPEGNTTAAFNWIPSCEDADFDCRVSQQRLQAYYENKDILPSIACILVNAYILMTLDTGSHQIRSMSSSSGTNNDPAILLLSISNLAGLVTSCNSFVQNFNGMKAIITMSDDYEKDMAKLFKKDDDLKFGSNVESFLPEGITQLTGASGEGKTRIISALIDAIGSKIIYLPQSDMSDFMKMSPRQVVQFMQDVKNDETADYALRLACLSKDPVLELKQPSGGEHQKMRIARSIYQYLTKVDKQIWILDEPDNNIHPGTELGETDGYLQIMRNILQILRPDTKLIFTTHKAHALSGLFGNRTYQQIRVNRMLELLNREGFELSVLTQ